MDELRKKALFVEYSEVCDNFRLLTNIRFKLLAFLPLSSAAGILVQGSKLDANHMLISIFGLVVTIGLITYNSRNDQLYNEFVGRAASIERFLSLQDGMFANRPNDWFSINFCLFKWRINHGNGIYLIYSASCAVWLYGIIVKLFAYLKDINAVAECFNYISNVFVNINDVALPSFLVTLVIVVLIYRFIKNQHKITRKKYRLAATRAFKYVMKLNLPTEAMNDKFIQFCADLTHLKLFPALDFMPIRITPT